MRGIYINMSPKKTKSEADNYIVKSDYSGNNSSNLRKGYSDVLYFFLKGFAVIFTIAGMVYFFISDLKTSESKRITQSFIQIAQDNINSLEATGDTINNYLVSKSGELESEDSNFIWDIMSKTNLADMILWYTPEDSKWRHMSENIEYTILEYSVEKRTPELRKFLRHISEFPKDKAILNTEQIDKAFSIYWVKDHSKEEGRIPWLFTNKKKNGDYDFLLLISNIKNIFAFDEDKLNLHMRKITIREPYNNKVLFNYSYEDSNAKKTSLFKPLNLEYGLMMAGESWTVEMLIDPTMPYIIFTSLPLAILIIGSGFLLAISMHIHRQYRNESQLAYISETLADKNNELLNWENEKKKMINEFRKSEWEYRAIINAVSDIIFEIEQDGKFVFLNDTWENHEKILGENLFDFIHPEERKSHKEIFAEFTAGYRGAYRRETRFKLFDDKYCFVEIAFNMMRLSNNKARVVGTVTNIEKRKQAELAHHSVEQKYTDMFKNALNGIYQVAPNGKLINSNQAFASILGYKDSEDLMSSVNNIVEQIYVDANQRSVLEMQLTQHGIMTGIESEVRKKDNSNIWILENLRTIYDDDNNVDYFEGTIWDITERRETDIALRTAKMEAELTSRARIEFMANMSHELRTPLNAVIGFSEIIRNEVMGKIEQEVYKEYATDIHNSGKQLLNIINDILDLSQIEIGERELKENEFPLLRVVQSVLELLSHKIKESRVAITVDIPQELPRIFAEELAFKQIFMNIIGNAVKFTPQDGKITIQSSLDSENNIIIEVIDNGVGMTDKEIEKALEPFGQAEAEMARDNSGTGLGLSIVQALINLHQGRFMLVSKKDVGTTIKMVFPKERAMMRSVPKDVEAIENPLIHKQ